MLSVVTGVSQYNELHFSRLTTEDGLSSSWIRCIYQDKHGFIWFGSVDGLNRYDGKEFVIYRPDEKDRYSLISEAINYISEKEEGELWICTEQGVNILNQKKNVFELFPYMDKVRVVHAMTDHNHKTWFSSYSGIYCYNPSDSSLKIFRHDPKDPNTISSDIIEACYQDASNNIWIATNEGLNLYDPILEIFIKYKLPGSNSKDNNHIYSIEEDNENRLWLGVINQGLILFKNSYARPDKGEFIKVLDGSVRHLMVDKNNHLWIGHSLGLGLEIIDLNTYIAGKKPRIIHYNSSAINTYGISDNSISCIFQDIDNNVWVGTFAGGVNLYAERTKKFHSVIYDPEQLNRISNNVINCFLEDDPFFWIGTEKGLTQYDIRSSKFKHFFFNENVSSSLGANGIISLYKDSKNNLWVGTWNGGLCLFNYKSNSFQRFNIDSKNESPICSNHIFSILEDKNGNLWIGTDGGGLANYDYNSGRFKCFVHEPSNPQSIYHNAVNDICETSDGKIYISVYHSLELFDPLNGSFTHFVHNKFDTSSISAGNIIDIYEDSKKNIWVATTGGLNYFDQKNARFIRYTKSQGLPGNSIQAILEDDDGDLWLSTTNGISKFLKGTSRPAFPQFINYSVEDGLQGNEFVRRSALKSKSGQLYFGGTKGYSYFLPDSIFENLVTPKIVFTDIRVFDRDGRKSPYKIRSDINFLKQIVLDYNQSDFTIKYAGLSYINPEKNQYKYILEGYETEWHHVKNHQEATYTNLDPGTYVFKVYGSNNDGLWSKEPKSLEIIIARPWWNTILARVIYLIISAFSLYGFFRLRFRLLQNQKAVLEQKVNERTIELSDMNSLLEEKQEEITMQNEELSGHRNHLEQLVVERTKEMETAIQRAEASDKLKSAFLANMSHEIRTPMNAIVGFASLLKNEEISTEERREFLDIISSNCDILMVLINDILEISLIEANQLGLKSTPFYVDIVLEELESYFRLNNPKELNIEFKKPDTAERFVLQNDQTRFRQIISNLLNNAYKYTDTGHIWYGYEKIENEVRFFVEDSGIGIDESEYQNIFNYFHKIDKGDNRLYRGAGIGLSISNKLVELMGGKIWLTSEVGKGTTFFFSLPSAEEENNIFTNKVTDKNLPIQNLSGKLILVAEDEANNYVLIEKILRPTSADIVWAKNGKEALNYVKEFNKRKDIIVLMDIKMPVMNGIHASNEIKKINPRIPVIAVTAYAQAENREEILRHNFCDYLAKPLQPENLLMKIYKYANLNIVDF
jgi:signal transduction histidine kinase/ligand-binding sensor domain-containing protein/CheY-like chemotaxis protein